MKSSNHRRLVSRLEEKYRQHLIKFHSCEKLIWLAPASCLLQVPVMAFQHLVENLNVPVSFYSSSFFISESEYFSAKKDTDFI